MADRDYEWLKIFRAARRVFREFNDDADRVFDSDEWARRMLDAIEPLIRADERNKIAAAIRAEVEATDPYALDVDSWHYGMEDAAKIAEEGGR